MQFDPPNKTTVIADAEDIVLWSNLPSPTHFISYQTIQSGTNEWTVNEGFWEATFNPSGIYYFILSSPGYEDQLIKIVAE